MPELPEVEVVKIFLEDKLSNQTLSDLDILNQKSFIGDKSLVLGQKIKKFSRVGKQLSLHLSNGLILLVHLKMTGQLIFLGKKNHHKTILGHPTPSLDNTSLPNKSTRLVFTFTSGDLLFFNDQRKFGWVRLFTFTELSSFQKSLGLDIFDNKFTSEYVYHQLQRSSRAVKLVLLDQHFFAGIGNIYANDALFLAKIHPGFPSNRISKRAAASIHQNLIKIMQQSIQAGGSTARDNKYIRPDGTPGSNQFHFRVYQRVGESCLICGTKISRLSLGGRGTFFCPRCQK